MPSLLWAQADSTRLVSMKSLRSIYGQSLVVFLAFGFTSCTVVLTILIKKTKGSLIILAIYVDDILLTGSDDTGSQSSLTYL